MDEGLSRAVMEVFVRLFEKGLIYRGKYIINWCPRCLTALSDEEADSHEHEGNLWHLQYPLKDSVAVLPVIGRELPIIADEHVDPSFGTGLVKVTPAHDPNDYWIGQRHDLEFVNVMNEDATLNENAGPYAGYDRFKCREELVEKLKNDGLLEKVETHTHAIPRCQRCETVVEPYLSEQWFVRTKPLAEPALKAVVDGRIKFYPERFTKVYVRWMENIRDWCISRQLWWGHRIPVYYCDDCEHMMVKIEAPSECEKCSSTKIRQDEDVLDTWFSSWLWPFSTLGWPEKTPSLEYYYPTQLLATAEDIIFFWVAKMIMAGMEFMGDIPFADIYINGTVRDEIGRKMSKSLGNGIDPIEMIEKYSADSVRFSLLMLASEGQDINLAESRFEMGRNLSNKIWNAYRLLAMNMRSESDGTRPAEVADLLCEDLADRWIISRYYQTVRTVTAGLENYRLHDAISSIYDFFWHDYCDWYLELIKRRVGPDASSESRKIPMQIAVGVMEGCMRLLHPFMPFITEEIWQSLDNHLTDSIMISQWPPMSDDAIDPAAEADMKMLQESINAIRNIRGEMNVPPRKKVSVVFKPRDDQFAAVLDKHRSYIADCAVTDEITISLAPDIPKPAARAFPPGTEVHVPLAGIIDIDKEKLRLSKECEKVNAEIIKNEKKLGNENFRKKAPATVVDMTEERQRELSKKFKKLQESLSQLG
jgi:valyl-tRNA synthetase